MFFLSFQVTLFDDKPKENEFAFRRQKLKRFRNNEIKKVVLSRNFHKNLSMAIDTQASTIEKLNSDLDLLSKTRQRPNS